MTEALSHERWSRPILALDTAMAGCAVGVYNPQLHKALSSIERPMTTGQAEHLVPMIEEALDQAGVKYADLGALAVTRGPGAFTGLRIGLSTARALALALDIPAIGVETFSAILETAREKIEIAAPGAIIMETKRTDYYAAQFDRIGKIKDGGASLSLEKLLNAMENNASKLLIGDAINRFLEEAKDKGRSDYDSLLEIKMCSPASVARCALNKTQPLPATESLDVDPLYLRAPDVTPPKRAI